jgi:hypothetical protein
MDHRSTEASSASGENVFQTSSLVMIIAQWGRAPSWRIFNEVRDSRRIPVWFAA